MKALLGVSGRFERSRQSSGRFRLVPVRVRSPRPRASSPGRPPRGHRVSFVEPDAARVVAPSHQPRHVDSAARTRLHEDEGRGPRASPGSPGPGDFRRQSPEPPGHAGDPDRAAGALAIPAGASHGEGVLQGALQPRSTTRAESGSPTASTTTSRAQFFNAFPLPQREAGTRQTLRYIGEVIADGYSVLIFPEGRRTRTGGSTASCRGWA